MAWVRRWIVREFRYVIDKSLYPDYDKKNLFQLLWCSFVSMSFVWVGIALVANTLYRSVSNFASRACASIAISSPHLVLTAHVCVCVCVSVSVCVSDHAKFSWS